MADDKMVHSYDAKDIQVLEGLEAVRRRPGMYVGGTDVKALHHLVYEVVDNSIDEALAGVCSRIDVIIHNDRSVTVVDNGRGIPVDIHPQMKKPALEVVMTVLHAGGKFGGGGYKVSGGLHGVGVSAVNALSEWCEVEVSRNGQKYFQRYERGIPQAPVAVIGKADSKSSGTKTTFKYDPEIFKGEVDYRFETLTQRFREMAFVTKGVTIHILDERDERQMTFHFEGGITSFVRYLNRNKEVIHPVISIEKEIDNKVQENIAKTQRKFIIQEQIKILQDELGEDEDSSPEFAKIREKIIQCKMPKDVETKALEEFNKLRKTPPMSPESTVIRNYLDWLVDIPWHKRTKDHLSIKHVQKILDEDRWLLHDLSGGKMSILAKILVTFGSSASIAFGVWHFFVPRAWKWYSYIDPNATELIAAIRAINMFFSLSLVFIFTAYWWKRPIITVRRFSRIVSWLRSKRHP